MKKNLLFTALAATTLLFATSCQQDEVFVDGNEATVTFEVGTPEIATRAFSKGEKATKLQWAVYDESNTPVVRKENANAQEQHLQGTATLEGGKASVNISLAAGKTYKVLFWADAYGNAQDAPYTVDFAALKMNVNYTGAVCNDESRDAFYNFVTVEVDQANKTQEVTLTRPFAQLNIGTDDLNKLDGVSAAKTQVKVNVYNQLDLKTGFVTTGSTATAQTFTLADRPAETEAFPVNGYKYLAMNYLLVGKDKTVVDVEFSYGADAATAKTRTYTGIPVQPNYRTNIYGSLLTQGIDFDVTIEPGYNDDDKDVIVVNTNKELEAALKQNEKVIRILLGSDVELNLGGDIYNLGGASTDSIIIDGIGTTRNDYRKLTFAKSHMSCLGTVNPDATIIFRNINISGLNESTTWNTYDISFESNVQLENVTFDKAIALVNGGKTATLKNVTINETHDYYAMWISAAGQTVDIDGLTIESAGRGIKIDEQYVGTPAKVTLNVKNATFTTANKAAIMVKSVAGADITLENVNIENVAADNGYAVWVDEDAAAYADKVTVKGGLVKVEGTTTSDVIDSQEKFVEAAASGAKTIVLANGEYDLYGVAFAAPKVTIQGASKENCVLNVSKSVYLENKTINLENLTYTVAAGKGYTEQAFAFIHHAVAFNLKDCNADRLRLNVNKATIDNCDFTLNTNSGFDGYCLYYYGNDNSNVVVKNSRFNTAGKAIVIYSEHAKAYDLDVENCTFTSSNTSTDKAAIQMHTEYGISGTLDITECTATGFADVNGGLWNEINNNNGTPTNVFTITVDGKITARNNAQLQKALKDGKDMIYLAAGNYDLSNATIAADNVTIEGLDKENCVVTISKQLRVDNKTLTLKNLTTTVPTGLAYDEHNFAWIHYFKEFNMINCKSDGRIRLNCYSANIEGCEFNVTTSNGFDGYAVYYYGPNESNVTVKNSTFNTVGKAIVMYNEGAPILNLDVEKCTFTSSASTDKAAIQMHTEFGISGTLDITECTATGFADVNGGLWNELNNNTKVPTNKFEITVDGKTLVRTTAQLQKAINAGETEIELYDGTYDAKNFSALGKTLTLKGKGENTVIYISQNNDVAYTTFDGSNVTFENLTIKTLGGNYKGFARMNGNYKNCTIVNNYFTCYGKHVFEGCTFNSGANEHCMWTYGAAEVDFVNCKFNYSDRGINVYVDNGANAPGITSDVEFTKCEFITENTSSKGAVEVNSSPFTAGVKVALKECKAPANGKMVYVSPWDGTNGANATITVDGNEI